MSDCVIVHGDMCEDSAQTLTHPACIQCLTVLLFMEICVKTPSVLLFMEICVKTLSVLLFMEICVKTVKRYSHILPV